jgi:hypothetical protein
VLIHHYVWGWATEWTFFLVEICAAILYLYGWQRMSARNHLIVGWIYFAAAWLSLVVINGIITFMLTPGAWLETGTFWDGFFNPTYWPSLVMRTGVCLMLAGLYSLLVASRYPASPFKSRTVRHAALWGVVGLAVALPSYLWYQGAIPGELLQRSSEVMQIPATAETYLYWCSAVLGGLLLIFGLGVPRAQHTIVGLLIMATGLAWFGSFEWWRESLRKPYVIHGYMYANAIDVAGSATYQESGLLPHIEFRTGDDGADLFRRACRSCHTLSGYNALRPFLDGTDAEFIAGMVRGTGIMRGNMPPFLGTEEESQLIAEHLAGQIDQRPLPELTGLTGPELGARAWEVRCAPCHYAGGPRDMTSYLKDFSAEDLGDLLDMAGELATEMPPYTGSATEREALIQHMDGFKGKE